MVALPRLRLELLTEHHSTADFECEDAEFGEFLRHEALADMATGRSRTFVEIDEDKPAANNVAGFFTLRAHALRIRDDYFDDYDEAADEGIDGYNGAASECGETEVPLVELMYLARDVRWKDRRVGDVLMIDAIIATANAAEYVGFIGLHLRSTTAGVRLYERYDFQRFDHHPFGGSLRYILSIHDIRAIKEARESG